MLKISNHKSDQLYRGLIIYISNDDFKLPCVQTWEAATSLSISHGKHLAIIDSYEHIASRNTVLVIEVDSLV